MATIGSLAVNIVAQTDKFLSGMKQAQTGLGKFVSSISTAQNALMGLGAYGLASVVRNAIAATDALGDLATNLGVNVESLQALNFATEQLGGSQSALHTSLRGMRKVLGDAALGSTAAAETLQRLGLSTQQLLGLPIEQQFLAVVDALHGVQDASTQAALAQDIFGRGSKEMIAVVQAGSGEIVKLSDQLYQLGGILSQDSVAAMGEAQNALQRFSATFAAVRTAMISDYVPEIVAGVDLIGGALQGLRVVLFTVQANFLRLLEIITRGVKLAVDSINLLMPKVAEINTQPLQSFIDSFGAKATDFETKRADIFWGRGNGPLQLPALNQQRQQLDKNSSRQTELMQQIADNTRPQQPTQVQLAVAGVR